MTLNLPPPTKFLSATRCCVSEFLRQNKVLNDSFFHRAPAHVLYTLAHVVSQDHVNRVDGRVAALGTSTHLLQGRENRLAEIDLFFDPQATLFERLAHHRRRNQKAGRFIGRPRQWKNKRAARSLTNFGAREATAMSEDSRYL